jgi:transcriptional regulator with XRE-family HTH domain
MNKNLLDVMNEVLEKEITPGLVVRALRKKYEMTQKDLAEITGIKENNISAIEHNRIEVGLRTAEKLAAVFGINPARILFPNPQKKKSKEILAIEKRAQKFIKLG